ncbi:MAG: hypothetical protein QF511_10045 [Rhodospirillales bacterium]|nr:hypothetical protein [Rhodospirillales bacterium]MDP7098829.1 hypothetical protein [Rhodospirillales bacterium]MDP7215678.1 hypothetical protein [Rhodospirillales bacterium]HJO75532.1 hypothetical protein [Rhodospirillales bacterium]
MRMVSSDCEVRGKRGLAYSVYSQLYPLDHSALIAAGTANARVGVLRREWRRLAEAGVSGEPEGIEKTAKE